MSSVTGLRRTVGCALLALVICACTIQGAAASKISKHTEFLHGYERFGEQELPAMPNWDPKRQWKQMNSEKPTGTESKSMAVLNAMVSPTDSCSGNPYFPVWVAEVDGEVSNLKAKLFTLAPVASKLAVSVFRDVKTSDCHSQDPGNDIFPYEYKPPLAVAVIDVPSGEAEVQVKFPGLGFDVGTNVLLQVQAYDQQNNPQTQVRLFYDSATHPASFNYSCKCDP